MTVFSNKSFIVFLAVFCTTTTHGYTNSQKPRRSFGLKKSPSSPALFGPQQPGQASQESNVLKSDPHVPQHKAGLSQAAVNTDAGLAGPPRQRRMSALPGAAHGMLSPETVARMDENTANGKSNPAVVDFLRRYRKKGPMSCLEMLSDPDILPHLTQAMRDIV